MNLPEHVVRVLKAHAEKFADLPLLKPVLGALRADHDGETAEIRDLGEELYDAVETIGLLNPKQLLLHLLAHPSIESQLVRPEPWPVDRAEQLLDAWKFQRSLQEKAA